MSTPKGDSFVVVYATIVCLICSLLLATAASALKKPQEYNVEIDRKINVLKAFGVPITDAKGKRIKGPEVNKYFADHISEITIDGATGQEVTAAASAKQPLSLYLWKDDGVVTKYAFPVSGKGLWSTIYGYLALEGDLSTIAGITFYRHGETPGLGGEVEADWFQNGFKGKKVFADGKRTKFEVVKGRLADKYPEGNNHAVDGISGATLTGNGLNRFINADLDKYESYFKLHRGT
ncbi:MAG: NADH:ubiquinone reductase (Na(+)-transporting) subunit C [Kiritimatiellae bacterium]|nr:NADH:ubiquinone reductase (Na(+)-transporting) subunit C [Kiritimatiellia bacterium]